MRRKTKKKSPSSLSETPIYSMTPWRISEHSTKQSTSSFFNPQPFSTFYLTLSMSNKAQFTHSMIFFWVYPVFLETLLSSPPLPLWLFRFCCFPLREPLPKPYFQPPIENPFYRIENSIPISTLFSMPKNLKKPKGTWATSKKNSK